MIPEGVDKSSVTGASKFTNDFCSDSLDVVKLAMELDEEFGLDDFPEGRFPEGDQDRQGIVVYRSEIASSCAMLIEKCKQSGDG